MEVTKLGNSSLTISRLGLGCMGMSEFYGKSSESESINVIHRAIDLGVTLLDTADMYGRGENEKLVGRALSDGRRDQIVLATKFGIVRDGEEARAIDGRPEYVRRACDASLQRLGVNHIDLYYQHRVDPSVPIEETMGALKELVDSGKVRAVGLSEAAPETIRRAHKVHPLSALQTEYSLWSREPEIEHIPLCRELGITFVAYSPLGRGFLTGAIQSVDDFAEDDYRRQSPRFQGENFQKNLEIVRQVKALAEKKGVQASQLALAWLLAQGQDVVPIPGTKHLRYLEQNVESLTVRLAPEEMEQLNRILPLRSAHGDRYPAEAMKAVNR